MRQKSVAGQGNTDGFLWTVVIHRTLGLVSRTVDMLCGSQLVQLAVSTVTINTGWANPGGNEKGLPDITAAKGDKQAFTHPQIHTRVQHTHTHTHIFGTIILWRMFIGLDDGKV